MSINLRKHNEETYEKIQENFKNSKKVAVIHPTGTGKSFLALKLLEDNKDKNAIYLAPSNTILHNIKKNIFESEMDMSDFPNLKRITYQKLARLSDEEIEKLGTNIVILDEFHHCGAPEWGNGVDRLLDKNPDAQVLGLSATPIRYFDHSRDIAEEFFGDNIASEMTLEDAINNGILPRAKYVSALYEFDDELERMQEDINKIRNPEKKKQAQTMINNLSKQIDANTVNLPEILSEHMKEKNGKYVVFCKNIEDMQEKVEQAQSMFGKVNSNIRTYAVSSKLVENERTLRKFEKDNDENTLKLMFAVNMLNEGYHINDLDGVIMMRPTYSPIIYAQQLGRALTVKSEDSKEPLIIDLVNNLDSIKIIEDLYQKIGQYEQTGEHKESPKKQDGLIIYDQTKEFINVARKISELSERKKVLLQEKIDIIERYLEEKNDDIDLLTVYEGKPIGVWTVQIRSQLKRGNIGINPTKEQLEKLEELGITERKIDSTIDEKIDALIDWKKRYPDAKVISKSLGLQLNNEIIKKLEELAKTEGIEFSEFEKKYQKLRNYNAYVRSRASQGKLTEEQWNRCKEGELRGIFGLSTKIQELADKLKIDEKKVTDITDHFGSIDNFIKMYTEGKLSEEQTMFYNNNLINNMIDIDCNPFEENYSRLVAAVAGVSSHSFDDEHEFKLFSSAEIDTALDALDPCEKEIMQLRYGLIDGEAKTLKDLSKYFNITSAKIRLIEAKDLRKLRFPRSKVRPFTFEQLKENKYISDEEIKLLSDLENDILKSNLIFKYDSIDDLDFSKDKFDNVRRIKEQIKIREEESKETEDDIKDIPGNIKDIPENIKDMYIKNLDLSIGTYVSLHRAGIKTIAELSDLSETELMQVGNLNRECVKEITSKLIEHGIKPGESNETVVKEKFTLGELGFPNSVNIRLLSSGIRNIEDLLNTSDRMLEEKLYYEKKCSPNALQKVIEKRHELIKKYGFEEKREFNDNTPIVEVEEIPMKTIRALCDAGISTIGDLLRLSEEELLHVNRLGPKRVKEILKVRESFNSDVGLDEPDAIEKTTEEKNDEKDYSESKIEDMKTKKTELEAELKKLDEQIRKARELLTEYNKVIDGDKVNEDDKVPDFKDE